jgi:hypothetical protein
LGIKIGQSYPGREGLIEIIENRPEGIGFGGIPYTLYNNAKTNADYKRLWSLLNGTFKFGGSLKLTNARKWKHKEGGLLIKFQEGGKNGAPVKKNSWWKRTWNNIEGIGKDVGDFLKTDTGKGILDIG